jgi:hypothetical protein
MSLPPIRPSRYIGKGVGRMSCNTISISFAKSTGLSGACSSSSHETASAMIVRVAGVLISATGSPHRNSITHVREGRAAGPPVLRRCNTLDGVQVLFVWFALAA